MAWLVRNGKVLASLEVADTRRARSKGLLGRDGCEGAILLRPARMIHTVRMRFDLDVAYLDDDLVVIKVQSVPANRVALPVLRSHAVLETERGVMRSWGLTIGDQLEVRGTHPDGEVEAGPPDADDG